MRSLVLALLAAALAGGEPWGPATAARFAAALDAVCAEADAGRRAELFDRGLGGSGLDRGAVLAMAERREPPAGAQRPGWSAPWPDELPAGPCRTFHLVLPPGYDPAEARPLVVILDGGEGAAAAALAPALARGGAVIAAPLLPSGTWSDPPAQQQALALAGWTARSYRIDGRRIALCGADDAGEGAWLLARSRTELWCAIAVVNAIPARRPNDRPDRFAAISLRAAARLGSTGLGDLQRAGAIRNAVEDWAAFGIAAEFAEIRTAGDAAAAAWLLARPARAEDPTPLFAAATAIVAEDPLAIDGDPALALLAAGRQPQALSLLGDRILRQPTRRDHLLRALVRLPALREPFPERPAPADLGPPRWTAAAEDAALFDLDAALRLAPDPPPRFAAACYRHAAVIHAKRTLAASLLGPNRWIAPYQSFSEAAKACLQLDPGNEEVARIVALLAARVPRGR